MPLETDMFSIMPDETTVGEIFTYSLAHNDMEIFVVEDEEEIYYPPPREHPGEITT